MKKDGRYKSDMLRFRYINKFIKGIKILDVGNAEGYLDKLIKEKNPKKKFFTLDLNQKSDFTMDLNKPKDLNQKFDTIIAGEIIEHVDNPKQLVGFLYKHLNKKGRIILTTPNATGLQYILKPSWCVFYKDYPGHRHTFTPPHA